MQKSDHLSKLIRLKVLDLVYKSKAAHLASCFSCVDIISVIYTYFLDNKNYKKISRNKFILSKGHAAAALYSALYYKKIISKKDIDSYCENGSIFEEHPSPKIPGVEAATGSLGHGLPIGCGIALSNKIDNNNYNTYVLISDGECNEGSTWESIMFASNKKLKNLKLIIDYNKWQATDRTVNVLDVNNLFKKFKNFDWNVHEIDGHNHKHLKDSLNSNLRNQKPTVIIANTIKGKGVDFMEDDNNWHYKSPNIEEYNQAKSQILK